MISYVPYDGPTEKPMLKCYRGKADYHSKLFRCGHCNLFVSKAKVEIFNTEQRMMELKKVHQNAGAFTQFCYHCHGPFWVKKGM